jgi:hypothetical protein
MDGTTAYCSQGTFPDYGRSPCLLTGMAPNSAATQHALTNLHYCEVVRFLLCSLKQAVETGEVDDFDIGRAVSAKRMATTVPLLERKPY